MLTRTQTPLRVVVVDDSPDWASLLGYLLQTHGHFCAVAHHPAAALKLADTQSVDVFILDIELPGMDGYALGRELRKKLPESVFIGNSGWPRDFERQEATGFTFDYFLVKPWDYKALAQVLNTLHAT